MNPPDENESRTKQEAGYLRAIRAAIHADIERRKQGLLTEFELRQQEADAQIKERYGLSEEAFKGYCLGLAHGREEACHLSSCGTGRPHHHQVWTTDNSIISNHQPYLTRNHL